MEDAENDAAVEAAVEAENHDENEDYHEEVDDYGEDKGEEDHEDLKEYHWKIADDLEDEDEQDEDEDARYSHDSLSVSHPRPHRRPRRRRKAPIGGICRIEKLLKEADEPLEASEPEMETLQQNHSNASSESTFRNCQDKGFSFSLITVGFMFDLKHDDNHFHSVNFFHLFVHSFQIFTE